MMGSFMKIVKNNPLRRDAPRTAQRRRLLGQCTALLATLALPTTLALAALPAAAAETPVILVVGDSLSAEYGLRRGAGWVALLEQRLARDKFEARVVNASISGDTTSGGRSRLPALLKQHQPSHVVIELGGNDALRGLPLKMTESNLRAMTRAALDSGAKVLIAGMQIPPNYGRKYADSFAGLFANVAKAEGARLLPFLLTGVADGIDYRLFQPDRIHPSEAAHPRILENVWAVLRPMLS